MIDPQLIADIRFLELLDREDRQELVRLLDPVRLEAWARLRGTARFGRPR